MKTIKDILNWDISVYQQHEQFISFQFSLDKILNLVQLVDYFEIQSGQRIVINDKENNYQALAVGCEYNLNSENRTLKLLEEEWRYIKHHHYQIQLDKTPKTPIKLFNAMTFDDGEQGQEWQDFSKLMMSLPSLLIEIINKKTVITVTIDTDKYSLTKAIWQQRLEFLNHIDDKFEIQEQVFDFVDKDIYPKEWCQVVDKAIDEIRQGQLTKVVLARRKQVVFHQQQPSMAYWLNQLQQQQTNNYIMMIERKSSLFITATPELLVKVQDQQLYTVALAGSAPRDQDPQQDQQQQNWLLQDDKNLGEHQLVVDAIKQALEPICQSLSVGEQPEILTNKFIHHLCTPISGQLASSHTIISAVFRLHPTPALGGYPREQALQFIKTHELGARGYYGAPVGWLDLEGNGCFIVAIRSGVVQSHLATLYAGCGIVADSVAEDELNETTTKFKPIMKVLER